MGLFRGSIGHMGTYGREKVGSASPFYPTFEKPGTAKSFVEILRFMGRSSFQLAVSENRKVFISECLLDYQKKWGGGPKMSMICFSSLAIL